MTKQDNVNILLVDDDTRNLQALDRTLEELDANLIHANSGAEALRLLLKNEFALILMDVQMPGMDGFETTSIIRKRKKNNGTPVIFLSAMFKTQPSIKKGYSEGAVDYILKPYQPDILRAKVRVFIDLFQKTEELKKSQQEKVRQQEKARQMEDTLQRYRLLSSRGFFTSVTSEMAGSGPVSKRAPRKYRDLVKQYGELMEAYLEHLTVTCPKPHKLMDEIVRALGNLGAGPRDMLDIHLESLDKIIENSNEKRARAYVTEGRLLGLEIMGKLVDYYQIGNFAPAKEGKKQSVKEGEKQ
ncbi:MAG: response regulator [Proteobacteria bacterium]|nr:response regulator [Pseudomonadota bacterium]